MLFLGRIQNSLEGILLKVDLIYYIRPKLVEPQLSQSLPAPPPPPPNILARQSFAEFLLSTLVSRQPQFASLAGLYKFGMSGLIKTHPTHLKYSRNV